MPQFTSRCLIEWHAGISRWFRNAFAIVIVHHSAHSNRPLVTSIPLTVTRSLLMEIFNFRKHFPIHFLILLLVLFWFSSGSLLVLLYSPIPFLSLPPLISAPSVAKCSSPCLWPSALISSGHSMNGIHSAALPWRALRQFRNSLNWSIRSKLFFGLKFV